MNSANTSSDTVLNKVDIRSINTELHTLFQRYSLALTKMNGGDILGFSQVRQIKGVDGLVQYGKGDLLLKNGIDKFQHLMSHRKDVAAALGVSAEEIYGDRRDLAKVQEWLTKQDATFEFGERDALMQLYISKHDGNVGDLDSSTDWVNYVLTQDWVTGLADLCVSVDGLMMDGVDYRASSLADLVQGMMKDHEIAFHERLSKFDPSILLDKVDWIEPDGVWEKYANAKNMLNSMQGGLDYVFYEMYKPIGMSSQKHVKVRLHANGDLEMSGTIGLSDCEHLEWEHGSQEYLRSLNTGNERYLFKLSLPFNDQSEENPYGSTLWWKPDEPEQLEFNQDEEGEVEDAGYRYYKPYETERFLRWLGTTYIPMIDIDTITKLTVCQSPRLSNDVQSDNFFLDATNVVNTDMARAQVDDATSMSLLSLTPKATVEMKNMMDGTHVGQYLEFIVSGHQQTSVLSFNVRGKMLNVIQEMTHYLSTWELLNQVYESIMSDIIFLKAEAAIHPELERKWNLEHPGVTWIPSEWEEIAGQLESLMDSATTIDLLRMRQIELEALVYEIHCEQVGPTKGEMEKMEEVPVDEDMKLKLNDLCESIRRKFLTAKGNNFYDKALDDYVYGYTLVKETKLNPLYASIPMVTSEKNTIVRQPLRELHLMIDPGDLFLNGDGSPKYDRERFTDAQIDHRIERQARYDVSFKDITVDELRERLTTLNNLIVRLPITTYHNKLASRHIFKDWKRFVDGAISQMVENVEVYNNPDTPQETKDQLKDKLLYLGPTKKGIDSAGVEHEFRECYIDENHQTPLIDYSYCYDDEGKLIHDRWDYWTEQDFS